MNRPRLARAVPWVGSVIALLLAGCAGQGPFVSRASGTSHFGIIFKHVLPNTIYSVLIVASMNIGITVLYAAALSFLGLGADSGYADWGQMVSTCRDYIVGPPENRLGYWYVVFTPGFVLALFVLGWNLLGDAARDVFDPKMRRR